MRLSTRWSAILILTALAGLNPWPASALNYQRPPDALARLVEAPFTPVASVDPKRQWLLLLGVAAYPPLQELAQPEVKLAGLRINPARFGPSQPSDYAGLQLQKLPHPQMQKLQGLPTNLRIGDIAWSPDGRHLAFSVLEPARIALWVLELATGKARALGSLALNDTYGKAFAWATDSQHLIAKIVPIGQRRLPVPPLVPAGPVIQEASGEKAAARTYQDLLKNPYDEALFDYYLDSQLVKVSVAGKITSLGIQGAIDDFSSSPDGRYLMVSRFHRPYSYLVPAFRFPRRVTLHAATGQQMRQLFDIPLQEQVPLSFDGVPQGPRELEWRPDFPATLIWAEALDGGDPAKPAPYRDQVMSWNAPFQIPAQPLLKLEWRLNDWYWGATGLIKEAWYKTRQARYWQLNPLQIKPPSQPLLSYSTEDRYNDPGTPLLAMTPQGVMQLLTTSDRKKIFWQGAGASPEGDLPFVDAMTITNGQRKRIWRAQAPYYETLIRLLDPNQNILLTRRESQQEPPNFWIRQMATGQQTALTHFPHPLPEYQGIQRQMLSYKRADGVELNAKLYLPPGYKPSQGPLPLVMWAYPREFKSATSAGQVKDSPYRFVRLSPSSPLYLVTQGYAVLDDPAMPIIGQGQTEPNDTYIEQLVASADAAVKEVVRLGVADPQRIAVGGHSYGAFMVANLLAHSDLFCTGIARSGAYNRTLTPFGFQGEERTLWQQPQLYWKMSPFMVADKINEPLLMIHGQADSNPGTFTLQSERLFQAIKGVGGQARLVLLPLESHGYQGKESLLHVLWETTTWLDRNLKHASPRSHQSQ